MKAPRVGLMAALALAVLTLSSGSAYAAAGDLDPTFDGDGKRVLPFAGIPSEALVQPDGKIVLAGFDELHEFAVWRLNPDGSLDRSFDGDGTVAISFGAQDSINAAALQPDGKIVVAGGTYAAQTRLDMAVARLNPNGSLDKTFDPGGPDGDGKKVFSAENDTSATAVVVQPDGRILLAGAGTGVGTFSLTRLDSKGAVDGTVFEDPPGFRYELAADMSLQADGTIVVAGEAIPELEQATSRCSRATRPKARSTRRSRVPASRRSPACIRSTCWCARLARSSWPGTPVNPTGGSVVRQLTPGGEDGLGVRRQRNGHGRLRRRGPRQCRRASAWTARSRSWAWRAPRRRSRSRGSA